MTECPKKTFRMSQAGCFLRPNLGSSTAWEVLSSFTQYDQAAGGSKDPVVTQRVVDSRCIMLVLKQATRNGTAFEQAKST